MKKCYPLVLLSLYAFVSFSQNELPVFGQPDIKELLMKDCEFEKGAPAVKIYKLEKTELINEDMLVKTERIERIKIFNSSGYKYADIEIPFSRENRIKGLSAIIYNLDETGNLVTQKIEKEDIFKQSSKKKKGTLVFTFPGLKAGSVIEYKFTELEKDASIYDVKYFQSPIPVQLCVFKIITPNTIKSEFTFIGENTDREILFEKNTPVESRITQTIIRKKILSFKNEPFMSSINDNLQYCISKFVPAQAWSDSIYTKIPNGYNKLPWSEINNYLLYHPFFGKQTTLSLKGCESVLDSAKKITKTADKVGFIYRTVKNRIKWNDQELIFAEDVARAWKTGIGSSAEMNLTLFYLLKKSNIDCSLVLVKSREYGKVNLSLYSLSQFNTVNVLVLDSSTFYVLDATKKYLSFKAPPYEVINRNVFIIDALRSQWLSIINPSPFIKKDITIKAILDDNGNVVGKANVAYHDFLKEIKLSEKENKISDPESNEISFQQKNSNDIKIDSLIEQNADNDFKPLTQTFNFTYKPEASSDYIFPDPLFLSAFRKNPFSEQFRRTDIDFGCNQHYTIDFTLTLPDNFEIENLSKNLIFSSNDSNLIFIRQLSYQNNTLVCQYSFEIKRATFLKEEYPAVKEFFRKMYDAINEKLILRKK